MKKEFFMDVSGKSTILWADHFIESNNSGSEILKSAGYDVKQAFDGNEFLYLMENSGPDILLLNMALPGINAIELSRTLKSDPANSALFILLLADEISETEIKAGADGYLALPALKKDLLPTIKTAQRVVDSEKKLKNLQRELQEAESKRKLLTDILEKSSDEIFVFDTGNLNFSFVNKPALINIGYTSEELKSLTLADILPAFSEDSIKEMLQLLINGKEKLIQFESFQKSKNSNEYPVEVQLRLTVQGNSNIIICTIKEINLPELAEESERPAKRYFERLIEKSTDGIVLVGIEGRFKYVSHTARRLFGYTDSDEELPSPYFSTYPDDLPMVLSTLDAIISNPLKVSQLEYRFQKKDGSWLWVESTFTNQLAEKEIEAILINFRDISERKLAEAALKESEVRFRSFVENANDIVYSLNSDRQLSYVSPNCKEKLGFEEKELIGKLFDEFIHPDDQPACLDFIIKLFQSRENKSGLEYRILHKNGSWRWHVSNISVILDTEGEIALLIGISRDVTEKKLADDMIRESAEKLERAQRIAHIGSWEDNMPTGELHWSEEMYNIMGFPADSPVNISDVVSVFPPEELERFQIAVDNAINHGIPYSMDYRIIRKDGTQRFIHDEGEISRDEKNNPTWMYGTTQDITLRMEAESLLRQTRINYETFFNTIDDFLFVLDEQGNIVHTNKTVRERLEYTEKELCGASVLMVHPPDQREEAGRIVNEMLAGNTGVCVVPLMTKSGKLIPVETRVSHGIWNDIPAIFGVTKDISKIKISEEKFSKVFYLNPSICGLSDIESGNYLEVNEAFCKILGFDKNEVIGKTPQELGIISKGTFKNVDSTVITADRISNVEAELFKKNGEPLNVLVSGEVIIIQDKKVRYTVVHDITEHKIAEKAIRESEQLFSDIFYKSPVIITLTTPFEGKIIDVNETFLKEFEYLLPEVIGKTTVELGLFKNNDDRDRLIDILKLNHSVFGFEVPFLSKNGKIIYGILSVVFIQIKGETLQLTTIIDISRRKEADDIIKNQLEELRRWHEVMLNREDRVLELKNEVNQLLIQSGKSARYQSAVNQENTPLDERENA